VWNLYGAAVRGLSETGGVANESVATVLNDIAEFVNDSVAAHGFSCMGLRQLPSLFQRVPVVPSNPDPDIAIGIGDPNTPEARQYAVWKKSEALVRVSQNGPVETTLGQQWIVYVYAAWEHEFRPRLAAVYRCDEGRLAYPLLGDLRHLRNDVVHHRGIATARNTGRCDVIRHWFVPGDVISLRGEHFAEFVYAFPLAAMRIAPG
jgi:hypothetical protein